MVIKVPEVQDRDEAVLTPRALSCTVSSARVILQSHPQQTSGAMSIWRCHGSPSRDLLCTFL